MIDDEQLLASSTAVERRLVADLPAAQRDVPAGLRQRVLAGLESRTQVRRGNSYWMLAASLLVGWLFLAGLRDERPRDLNLDLAVVPLRDAVEVDVWVASSADALHRRVDVALLGEWQALVTDASRAATSVLDGFVRPLRGLSAQEEAR